MKEKAIFILVETLLRAKKLIRKLSHNAIHFLAGWFVKAYKVVTIKL